MPKAFDSCVKRGGRVRTVTGPNARFKLKRGQYRRVCFLGDEMHMGHVKTRTKKKR